jgi:tetratricopeptide (TPR) repeat protein
LLDQQYFGNQKYHSYLTNNFVALHLAYKNERGKMLFEKYGINGTPTTIIADSKGNEIDRIVGFSDKGAPEFQEKIIAIVGGTNKLAVLQKVYEETPEDIDAIANLANAFIDKGRFEDGKVLNDKLLEYPELIKNRIATFKMDDKDVPLIEFAHLGKIIDGPEATYEYIMMFPEGVYLNWALNQMTDYMGWGEEQEKASDLLDRLIVKYSGNKYLANRYCRVALRKEKNLDKAVIIANSTFGNDIDGLNKDEAERYASVLLANGNTEKAFLVYGEKVFDKMIADNDAGSMNGMSWFWALEAANLDFALKVGMKSIELKDDANTWDTVSMVYWKMGEHQKAIEAEEKAIELYGGESESLKARIEAIKEDMAE